MAALSIFLPPFSPDYSGVSSVLFDLKTVTAMHDASGCTGNYTGYDEPRWYGSHSPIFCSGLREIDAILGDDEKLIQKMIAAANDLHPDLMALVGSPVPMVIGSDLVGIAAELEARTGIPSFGFDTTGTEYYDKGAAAAAIALLHRFTDPAEPIPGAVNIVGATPLDFGTGESLDDLRAFLFENEITVTACLSMGYTLDDLKRASSAGINLAVSRTGLLIADFMEQRYGIPYLCGLPFGDTASREYLDALQAVRQSRRSRILKGEACEDAEMLILGEQVQANAIRLALSRECGIRRIAVGCLFGIEPRLALPQDRDLPNERGIMDEMRKDRYHTIIADPFLQKLLPHDTKKRFLPNPHYAVSSKLGGEPSRMVSRRFNQWIKERR